MLTTTRRALLWLLITRSVVLLSLSLPAVAVGSVLGTVTGTVQLRGPSGTPVDPTGVVVYLEAVPASASAPGPGKTATPNAQVHQQDLQFTPPLTVIKTGDTVEFPNNDKVFHNVFSFSEAAKFDLGLYKSGTTKSVTFRKPGAVNVYCNIHPEMISRIKILDSSFYVVVGKDGAFRIPSVPPGTYPLVAWHISGAEVRTQVTVSRGRTEVVSLTLDAGTPERRHLRKDGTPYGRYK